jgi:LemA protein
MLGAYNRLVALRGAIVAAWAQLDAVLQQRAVVNAQLAAQQPAFALPAPLQQLQQAVDALRQRPASAERATALAAAEAAWQMVLAERIDTLATAAPDAVAELHELQPRLAFARQLYNDAVAAYNDAAAQFPTRLLTRLFGFGPAAAV